MPSWLKALSVVVSSQALGCMWGSLAGSPDQLIELPVAHSIHCVMVRSHKVITHFMEQLCVFIPPFSTPLIGGLGDNLRCDLTV